MIGLKVWVQEMRCGQFEQLELVFTFQIEEKRGGGGVKLVGLKDWGQEMRYGHFEQLELVFMIKGYFQTMWRNIQML